ncbi:organic cation transporter protein [Drosophila busckii]|uniref:organic cation transporter protein n=1 Tax=Drosophila busckii TaxID=30019 RepID=UPI00083EAC94|nr:organic cation transporter protein [Drosophila busckii]
MDEGSDNNAARQQQRDADSQTEERRINYLTADQLQQTSKPVDYEPRSYSTQDSQNFFDFDDLLPMIGEFGLFQKLLFVCMIPFFYIAAFVYLHQIFLTLPPRYYYCFVPELSLIRDEAERKELSIPQESDGSYSRCRMYDTNYTAVFAAKNRTELVNSSLSTIPCRHGYVFDKKDAFRSATADFGWVCANDGYATYAQMIYFVGSVCGCLGYGHLADHCGRLAALVSSSFLALVGGLFTVMCKSFWAFAVTRLVVGASFDTCFTMIYILVLEYVGPRYRTFVGNMSLALFYSPFTMVMPWMALGLGNWRRFVLFGSLPICFALFSYCLLPESARWLVSVGKIDDALIILQRISRWNRKPLPDKVWDTFRESCLQFYKEEFEGRAFTICSLLRRRRMARYMVLMIGIWMSISLVYDGHVRAASVLDKDNVFIIFTIACATELPGNLLVIAILDRLGRRWCAFAFTTLSGIFSLVAANLVQPKLVLSAALAGRFCANVAYNIGLQWAAEILPTVVRAQGVAFIHTMGFVAMLLSPPVIYLSHLSGSLMLNILGALGMLGGLLSLFLPETLYQELPQTLSDGDQFGKHQGMWHAPCCGPGSKPPRRSRTGWHQGSSLRTLSKEEYRSEKLHRVAVVKQRNVVRLAGTISEMTVDNETVEESHRYV